MSTTPAPRPAVETLAVHAMLVGERIDTRALAGEQVLATAPLTIAVGEHGIAVVARFGTVVLFGVDAAQQTAVLDRVQPLVSRPYPRPEIERVELRIDPAAQEGVLGGVISLRDRAPGKLQLIADVLGKSVLLGLYESRIAQTFDRIEPLAAELERSGRVTAQTRTLMRHIGATLISEHRMIGRAEISEKPELLWEQPALEALFVKLEDEYEIRERYLAIEQKLDLVSRTATTLLELLHNRHSLRVEWYIVILIVAELVLSLFSFFGH